MNEKDVAEQLYAENETLVHGALRRFFPTFAFNEDIQQVARIGLWKACLHYDTEKSRFSTAAYRFIVNEVSMELRKKRRKSEPPTVSLNALLQGLEGADGTGEIDFLSVLPCAENIDWCDWTGFRAELTEHQRFVARARLMGLTDEAIAAELGVCISTVARDRKVIRQKAEEIL